MVGRLPCVLFNASSYCTDQISIRTNSITSPKIKTAVDQSPGCASVGLARQFLYIGQIANSIMPPATKAKICIHSISSPQDFNPIKNPTYPSLSEVSVGFHRQQTIICRTGSRVHCATAECLTSRA